MYVLQAILLASSVSALPFPFPLPFPKGGGGRPGGGGGSTSSSSSSSSSSGGGGRGGPGVAVGADALAGIIIASIIFIIIIVLVINCLIQRQRSRRAAFSSTCNNRHQTQTTTIIYPGQYPKPGSFLSSFNNASEAEFEAGAQFQRLFPTSSRPTVTPAHINEINRVGPQEAWVLEFEAGNGVSGALEKTSSGGGGQILTFSKPATTVSLLSRLPIHIDPFTPGRSWFYFEVTIQEITISPNPTVVSVGLATKPYPPFRHIGWNQHSVGFHSDDGRAFQDDPFGGRIFASPYTRGDTIGCGYDPARGAVFYTLNGTHLGDGSLSPVFHDYHIAVAADGPCQLYINVGGRAFIQDRATEAAPGAYAVPPS
ncbi:hypothetical protein BC829DRAFT_394018 [Chytridium lagenaria]|nr:hypothetical protein BC829DRAFT_394018 [Chytridium lagenaria]